MKSKYLPQNFESKWIEKWEKDKIYRTPEGNNKIYAFSLKGEELLGRGFLFKIDGSTDSVIESYIIGSNGTDIAFHPKAEKVYVTHTFNGTIDGYNLNKNQLICNISN